MSEYSKTLTLSLSGMPVGRLCKTGTAVWMGREQQQQTNATGPVRIDWRPLPSPASWKGSSIVSLLGRVTVWRGRRQVRWYGGDCRGGWAYDCVRRHQRCVCRLGNGKKGSVAGGNWRDRAMLSDAGSIDAVVAAVITGALIIWGSIAFGLKRWGLHRSFEWLHHTPRLYRLNGVWCSGL